MDKSKKNPRKFFLALLFMVGVLFTFDGGAQQPPIQSNPPRSSLHNPFVSPPARGYYRQAQKTQASKPTAPATGQDKCVPRCDELLAKARQQGLMSIMVSLAVPNLPDETRVPKEKRLAVMREREAAISRVQDRVLQRMRSHKIQSTTRFTLSPGLGLTVDAAALQTLITDPEVIHIHESQIFRLMLNQSGPLIGAPQAWANGFSGAGYTVAILDTGIDGSHSFLAGKVVIEACYSGTPPGSISLCPGGQPAVVGPGAAAPCQHSGCDHGTHVAGIAAGTGPTFSGVAKDAQIIAVQVFSYDPLFNDITSSERDIQAALDYVRTIAVANNVVAVNLSLGGGAFAATCDTDPTWEPLKSSIDALRNLGVATVVASGNNSCTSTSGTPTGCANAISAPACISTAISVGATTKADTIPSNYFSNSASFLNLLAPGGDLSGGAGDIYSSVPGGSFDYKGGTSMAAPHVAGAFAVLKQQSPSANVSDLLASLQSSAVQITDPRNNLSKPRIRLGNLPWIARYHGPLSNGANYPARVATDVSGNVYVTGASDASLTSTEYATVKYGPMGNQLWARRYNNGVYGGPQGLAVDGSGNVYVTGFVCKVLDVVSGLGCTSSDAVTIKYDTNGNLLWVASYSGAGYTWASALSIDGSGNVYITGASCSGPNCQGNLNLSGNNTVYATVKYDANGGQLWAAQYSSAEQIDFASALAVDGSGNVYVTGSSCNVRTQNPDNCTSESAVTVSYDPYGNQRWVTRYAPYSYASAIAVDGIGNVYITGSGGAVPGFLTVKYNTYGNQLWVASYGNNGANAIVVDTTGNVYVTGSIVTVDDYDYLTVKYSVNGGLIWANAYSNPGNDDATAIKVDSSGNIYITGVACVGYDTISTACADQDFATIKYGPNGNQLWSARQRIGDDAIQFEPSSVPDLAVDGNGNVYVTGASCVGLGANCAGFTGTDYVTLKYVP